MKQDDKYQEDVFTADDPYTSPGDLGIGAPHDDSSRENSPSEGCYDAARGRRLATVISFLACALLDGCAVLIGAGSGDLGKDGLGEVDMAGGMGWIILSAISSQLNLVAIILMSVWGYRAYKNLGVFTEDPLRFSPGWVAAYWYIPIASLYRPVQSINDVWRYSSPEQNYDDAVGYSTPGLIVLWWFLWLASAIIGMTTGFVLDTNFSPQVFATAFGIVPSLMTAYLVNRLGGMQDALAKALGIRVW